MKVWVLEAALFELEQACAYYDFEHAGFGEELVIDFNRAIRNISTFPNAWVPMRHGLKAYFCDRFPYKIIYRIEDAAIIVLALSHHHRKPDYWKDR